MTEKEPGDEQKAGSGEARGKQTRRTEGVWGEVSEIKAGAQCAQNYVGFMAIRTGED